MPPSTGLVVLLGFSLWILTTFRSQSFIMFVFICVLGGIAPMSYCFVLFIHRMFVWVLLKYACYLFCWEVIWMVRMLSEISKLEVELNRLWRNKANIQQSEYIFLAQVTSRWELIIDVSCCLLSMTYTLVICSEHCYSWRTFIAQTKLLIQCWH